VDFAAFFWFDGDGDGDDGVVAVAVTEGDEEEDDNEMFSQEVPAMTTAFAFLINFGWKSSFGVCWILFFVVESDFTRLLLVFFFIGMCCS